MDSVETADRCQKDNDMTMQWFQFTRVKLKINSVNNSEEIGIAKHFQP